MKYKYILFDLDGTITESGPGIMNSVEYALNKMNREVGERDTLKKFIGPPLTESMEKYYGMSEEEALLGVKYYREYYAVKGIFENSVYEGLAETLESLENEGYILAVATSKPEEYAKRIADKFDFAKYFAGIYGATMDGSLIRKADVIRYALDNLGVFKGRGKRPMLKCGICGEHGGEPTSVEFCHYAGLNYVSCSPFRVPIARLAAAHAALKEK